MKRITVNNTNRVVTITNSVFETLTADEEKIIARYESRDYSLSIVDDKKKESSSNVKLTNKQILINATAGSREMGFSEEESKKFIDKYNEIKKEYCFQTAKGFYLEIKNAIDKKSDRSVDDVYSFYNKMIDNKVA